MYANWPPQSMEHLIIAETSDMFDEAEGALNTSETLNCLHKSIENASFSHEFWTQQCATKLSLRTVIIIGTNNKKNAIRGL